MDFLMEIRGIGCILTLLEAADANSQAWLARPGRAIGIFHLTAKLHQRTSSYDQIVGSHH